MVASVCLETGWTWDHVLDTVDTERLERLTDAMRRLPTARDSLRQISLILQHQLGVKEHRPQDKRSKQQPLPDFAALPDKED